MQRGYTDRNHQIRVVLKHQTTVGMMVGDGAASVHAELVRMTFWQVNYVCKFHWNWTVSRSLRHKCDNKWTSRREQQKTLGHENWKWSARKVTTTNKLNGKFNEIFLKLQSSTLVQHTRSTSVDIFRLEEMCRQTDKRNRDSPQSTSRYGMDEGECQRKTKLNRNERKLHLQIASMNLVCSVCSISLYSRNQRSFCQQWELTNGERIERKRQEKHRNDDPHKTFYILWKINKRRSEWK